MGIRPVTTQTGDNTKKLEAATPPSVFFSIPYPSLSPLSPVSPLDVPV